ncbi:hypothetical protein H6761_03255 [Candidatus Nomurabacteria bacterium]|nr:hypothetical protein [Candidatus Nomurabacteria bacterium]
MENQIKYKNKISLNQAKKKIIAHAFSVNYPIFDKNYNSIKLKNVEDVSNYLKQNNYDLESLAEKCRDYTERVPLFENLLSTTWQVISSFKNADDATNKNGSISLVNESTGKTELEIKSNGEFAFSPYQSKFEKAVKYLNMAVNNASFEDFLTAITSGISSIETYLNYRAGLYNNLHSNEKLIDNQLIKVRFEDKIDWWIPKMTNKKIDKSADSWRHFKELKNKRDKLDQHNHNIPIGGTYVDLCQLINKFRSGIAQFINDLHVIFNEKTPTCVINAIYMPDVEIINNNK